MIITPDRKAEIRNRYLNIRDHLNSREVKLKSDQIVSALLKTDAFTASDVIHVYVSMADRNEVNTHNLIKNCLVKGKTVVIPKMMDAGRLNHVALNTFQELRKNSFGVLESESDIPFNISKISLVIVPMVAGDLKKNRLGYGKGYYDRFLKKTDAVKIGLLFENQLYPHDLPTESFDIQLDFLITEKRIIE
jgi:5-formyltetrahydrofolate cyclo-ligase